MSSETREARLEGKWEQAKGRVREAWGALSDDDVARCEGKWDRLVGTIRERTGETLEKVEAKLGDILDSLGKSGPNDSGSAP